MISEIEYINHILEEIKFIFSALNGVEFDQFNENEILKRAVVRSLEIIGEASKKVSADFKAKYSHVEWKAMAGTRDRLIHNYIGVDYMIVWSIYKTKLSILEKELNEILSSLKIQ